MYRNILELVDGLNWLAEACNMKVRHFRLYRKTADRSREVVLLYNPSYAGYAGDDIDLKYYLHIWVIEKETTRMCDAPITCWAHRLDIREVVADDFTLIVDGEIRVAGVCAGVVHILPESPSLGGATQYSPAFLHEGRKLHLDWFIY